jgi:hypothetical protein
MRTPSGLATSANFRASVAMPERRWMKLSAVRSAVSSDAVGPATRNTTPPGFTRSPSRATSCTFSAGSTRAKTWAATSSPQTTRSWPAAMKPRERWLARKIARLVTSPSPASSSSARSIRWSVRGSVIKLGGGWSSMGGHSVRAAVSRWGPARTSFRCSATRGGADPRPASRSGAAAGRRARRESFRGS